MLTEIGKPVSAAFEFSLVVCGITVRRAFDQTELRGICGVGGVYVEREGDCVLSVAE